MQPQTSKTELYINKIQIQIKKQNTNLEYEDEVWIVSFTREQLVLRKYNKPPPVASPVVEVLHIRNYQC